MKNNDEKQRESQLRQFDDTIRWYQAILDNPGVAQSAKDAARDMLKQAEKAKRDFLSGERQ